MLFNIFLADTTRFIDELKVNSKYFFSMPAQFIQYLHTWTLHNISTVVVVLSLSLDLKNSW